MKKKINGYVVKKKNKVNQKCLCSQVDFNLEGTCEGSILYVRGTISFITYYKLMWY